MKIGLDATPLLGSRTGIGHYVGHLISELSADPNLELVAVPFTARGGGRPVDLPANVRWRHLPAPARLLQRAWASTSRPSIELLSGSVDVFHGTNFVLPPSRRAAGVLTVHDLSFLRYPELVSAASLAYRTLVPRGLVRAGAVITPTAAVAAELIADFALDPELVHVTPLGVDRAWFDTTPLTSAGRAEFGLPAEYILAVGTFEPRKGLDLLVAAYRQLLADDRSGSNVPPLVLVGPKGWGPELELADLPQNRVICPGYLAVDVLRRVVAGATVFAFPSRYEGFGLPPLEALAAGVRVVGSDIPTSVEVLGEHAALPPVGDIEALANELRTAIDSPDDAVTRQRRREHASEWTWQRCAGATVRAYRSALAVKGP